MKKKDSSSWSEIKSLDERLEREPDSFCFARLSEVYLKVGLVADALHTARQGVARHPGYLAGQRALAMACNANGLYEESRSILEKVTAATPEDTAAQSLLASLYVDTGDKSSAIRVYMTLLDFRPEDVQCKVQLEKLRQDVSVEAPQAAAPSTPVVCDEKVEGAREEDIYDLSEDDIVSDEEDASGQYAEPVALPVAADRHDPLSTLTLAELYEQQGFIPKALDIYRSLLADDPANAQLQTKISQLEQSVPAEGGLTEHDETTDIDDEPAHPEPAAFEDMSPPEKAQDFSPLVHNQADNVVEALDNLLENIRRIKACR
jgi:tetratricopeptide (TPR) repeat protein